MYCKYLSKSLNGDLRCIKFKRRIIYAFCKENCSELKYEPLRTIKKKSSKRIFVKNEIYNKVFERDKGCCRLCGTSLNLELHHIIYRSEDKKLINEANNCIMLCIKCHKLVHNNKHYWQPILKEMIRNIKEK